LISACTKEGHHYTVSQEFKDYFLFQKGSYWIYKNDSTNGIDSTYLLGVPLHNIFPTGENKSDPTIEQYILEFNSDIMLNYHIETYTSDQTYIMMYIKDSTYAFGMISQLIADSNYYLQFFAEGYFKVLPTLPSIELNSIIFNNVLQTKFYNDKDSFNFYFAKNVGLIKIKGKWENKNHSWSLLRYNVFQ
jgi:hypothetical protein